MIKHRFISLLVAIAAVVLFASPGYCFREKPGDLVDDDNCT